MNVRAWLGQRPARRSHVNWYTCFRTWPVVTKPLLVRKLATKPPFQEEPSLDHKKAAQIAALSGLPVEKVAANVSAAWTTPSGGEDAAESVVNSVKNKAPFKARTGAAKTLRRKLAVVVGRTTSETAKWKRILQAETKKNQTRRRDIQYLRSILAAHHESMTEAIRPDVLVHPRGNSDRHIVFLCIDTEFRGRLLSELGLAALDTAVLRQGPAGWRAEKWFSFIQTSRFIVEDIPGNKKLTGFLFGWTRSVNMADLKRHIEMLFETWRKADRDVVIVGHALENDMASIRFTLGYNLASFPNVVGLLDTFLEMKKVHGSANSLKTVYERLSQTSALGYHNAGNDAVYTLRTLLMLATTPSQQWATFEVEKPCTQPTVMPGLSVPLSERLSKGIFGRVHQADKNDTRRLKKRQAWSHGEVEKDSPRQLLLGYYKRILQWLKPKVP